MKMNDTPAGENRVKPQNIFILIALLLILIIITSFMIYKDNYYGKIIADKKLQIEDLRKEIESMAPLQIQIDLYKQETSSIKEEIKKLKSGKGNL